MIAAAAAAAETSPWVGPAIVAALVSGLVSFLTVAMAGRRERKERHRQLMADAFAPCQAYKEFPYRVRRRRAGEHEAEDHSRISEEISAVQASLAEHLARLKVEAPAVSPFYADLVSATRRIAGEQIREGWKAEPVGPESGSSVKLGVLADIGPYESRYLESVQDHLSVWPYWLCRVVRTVLGRATPPAASGPEPTASIGGEEPPPEADEG